MNTLTTEPVAISTNFWQEEQVARNQALVALIDAWCAEDEAEDPEQLAAEWEALKEALDEDRLSDRKLFP